MLKMLNIWNLFEIEGMLDGKTIKKKYKFRLLKYIHYKFKYAKFNMGALFGVLQYESYADWFTGRHLSHYKYEL